jgi:hypothetical protein
MTLTSLNCESQWYYDWGLNENHIPRTTNCAALYFIFPIPLKISPKIQCLTPLIGEILAFMIRLLCPEPKPRIGDETDAYEFCAGIDRRTVRRCEMSAILEKSRPNRGTLYKRSKHEGEQGNLSVRLKGNLGNARDSEILPAPRSSHHCESMRPIEVCPR